MAWQAASKEGVGKWVPDAAGTVGEDGTFFSLTEYCLVADRMGEVVQNFGE